MYLIMCVCMLILCTDGTQGSMNSPVAEEDNSTLQNKKIWNNVITIADEIWFALEGMITISKYMHMIMFANLKYNIII